VSVFWLNPNLRGCAPSETPHQPDFFTPITPVDPAMPAPLSQYFDRIYVLNLPERLDRRRDMLQELAQVGVSAETTNLEVFAATKPTDADDFPSIGARGCFLSHLGILKAAHQAQLNRFLILEDDLAFSRFFVQHQTTILAQLDQQPWHIAYFGHVLPLDPPVGQSFVWQPSQVHLQTTHFLAIKGDMLGQLIDFLDVVLSRPAGHPLGGPMHVDGAYSTFREQHPQVQTLVANPCLGFQRSSASDVAGLKWFDRLPGLQQAVAVSRQVQTQLRKRRG
jgi:glycosyl transferase, family 25